MPSVLHLGRHDTNSAQGFVLRKKPTKFTRIVVGHLHGVDLTLPIPPPPPFSCFCFPAFVFAKYDRPYLIEVNCSPALGLDESADRCVCHLSYRAARGEDTDT